MSRPKQSYVAMRTAALFGPPLVDFVLGEKVVREHPVATAIGKLAVTLLGLYVDKKVLPKSPELRLAFTFTDVLAKRFVAPDRRLTG